MKVDKKTLTSAIEILSTKTKISTRILRNELEISGVKAGYILRSQGWIKRNQSGCSTSYYKPRP